MGKRFLLFFLIAFILRMTLSALTFHPDVRAFDLGGIIVSSGNILNLYDYLRLDNNLAFGKVYSADLFIYPPAIYLLHGLFSFIFIPLIDKDIIQNFLVNYPRTLGNIQLNLHLLFLKFPYFLFDAGAVFLLANLFASAKEKFFAVVLWLFNPINLHATYMMGQFDIIPTFFVIAALYLLRTQKNGRVEYAALSLGMGAAFKLYPLFLLIPLASLKESWRERVKVILLGILPYLITVAPFLSSSGFRSSALVAGQTLKSFYSQIAVSGGESIILFLAALLYFYNLFLAIKAREESLWSRFFIILLLFFIFTHYHPQWFLWLTPFLIIDFVRNRAKNLFPLSLALGSYVGLLFFFDSSLTLGIFSPLLPQVYNIRSIWEIFSLSPDYNLARSVLQTLFVGSALYYIYLYFPRRSET